MPELFEDNLIPIKTLADIFLPTEGEISPEIGQTLISPKIVGGILEGGSFRSSVGGARLEIFPEWDPTIGMIVYNAAAAQTFKILVDGTDTGDVIIGDYANDKGVKWDNSAASFTIKGSLIAGSGSVISGTYLTDGTVGSAKVKPSLRGSSHNLVFSASDADTVAWAQGTITLSDGTDYTISAGNTGDMSARTYIYLDVDTSTTALGVTTTMGSAVGESKILIASAENGTGEATFDVVGGIGGMNIDANSIIVSNLAAINADLGSITAGNMTIDASGYIKGGQTAYRTGYGFWEGYDTDTYKFSIKGTSGDEFYFDGVNIGLTSSLFLTGTPEWVASDDLRNSNDTEKTTQSTSYVKVKEMELNADLPICRIKFDVKRLNDTYAATGRIYKNGVAIGTEQVAAGTSYTTRSEDFADFVSGDLIQIYLKIAHQDYTAAVRNMRFYYGKQIRLFSNWELTTPLPVETDAISVTNQDP